MNALEIAALLHQVIKKNQGLVLTVSLSARPGVTQAINQKDWLIISSRAV